MTDVGARRAHRAAVPAGIVDSALSSLATFFVGLAAARYLGLDVLGTYALGYAAFLLAANIPGILVFTPAEVVAAASPEVSRRTDVLVTSLRLGLPVAVVAAVLVAVGTALVPSTTPVEDRVQVAVTVAALASLSPVQDHVRRLLHSAGRSWDAALTSGLQVAVSTTLLAALLVTDRADEAWAPFGVLAAANVVSTSWALLRCAPRASEAVRLTWARARSQGGVLVLGSVAQFGAAFAISAVVTARSGADAPAQVEAARIVSQPVTVVVVGLLSVLGPRVMAATSAGDLEQVRRTQRRSVLLVAALTAAWLLVTSLPERLNPVQAVVPRAFEVDGLLPLLVVAQAVAYTAFLYRFVPLALLASKALLVLEVGGAAGALATAAVLADRGPWAVVVASAVGAVTVLTGTALLGSRLLAAQERAARA